MRRFFLSDAKGGGRVTEFAYSGVFIDLNAVPILIAYSLIKSAVCYTFSMDHASGNPLESNESGKRTSSKRKFTIHFLSIRS